MTVQLVIAEGDSEDGTYDKLEAFIGERDAGDVLLKVDHGGPKYGSVDHPARWAQIALVCNAVMDAMPADERPKVYVESDLIWLPSTITDLVLDLELVPAVALCLRHGRFYDIWGHRGLDGERFQMSSRTTRIWRTPCTAGGDRQRPGLHRDAARGGARRPVRGERLSSVSARDIRTAAAPHLFLDRRLAVTPPGDTW
jgi:hypothetical protein